MRSRSPLFSLLLAAPVLASGLSEEPPIDFAQFENLMRSYCVECHNAQVTKGGVDFASDGSERALMSKPILLENMEWAVADEEMPPRTSAHQPTDDERDDMLAWLEWALVTLSNSRPNDPGRVVMPRLNHHQYQRVVQDLTGRDIDTSTVFPMGGAGASGFPNDGEGMTATPLEVEKFISAAKYVLKHARITPEQGIFWGDRASESLGLNSEELIGDAVFSWSNIIGDAYQKAFYRADWKNLPDFLEAAWVYENRQALGHSGLTIEQVAKHYDPELPAPILRKWHNLLTSDYDLGIYLGGMAQTWRHFKPGPQVTSKTVHDFFEDNLDRVDDFQKEVAEYRHQKDASFQTSHPRTVDDVGEALFGQSDFYEQVRDGVERGEYHIFVEPKELPGSAGGKFVVAISPAGTPQDDVVIFESLHAGNRSKLTALDRGAVRVIDGRTRSTSDGLYEVTAPAKLEISAPANADLLHLAFKLDSTRGQDGAVQIGLFEPSQVPEDISRLDGQLIVTTSASEEGTELRRSSQILHDAIHQRQWNIGKWKAPAKPAGRIPDRVHPAPVADSLPSPPLEPRMLDPDEVISMLSPEKLEQLDSLSRLIAESFKDYSKIELADRGQSIINQFAREAWRGQGSMEDLEPLYRMLRARLEEGHSFDAAVKMPLVAIMAHPRFMYQLQESKGTEESYPLTGAELASRLSLTLWGSVPDEELLRLAHSGQLQQPQVLVQQALRMLSDPKGKRLAKDFAGYWLGYEGFEEYAGVDQEAFAEFDRELRHAMYEEVVLFADSLLRGGEPITNALDADYTFVNQKLAEHYGISGVEGDHMRRVQLPADSPRGGVVTMGALLTKTSKPLRTSPVVRGDWVLQEILGEHVPAPPDNVPLLSDEAVDEEGRTLLEQLKVHRDNPACSSCHARMDPIGVAMENFDPIGRWREKVTVEVPVINQAPLPDGQMLDGIGGLKQWLTAQEVKFVGHFIERFVAYMLGRKVLPTDKPLIEQTYAAMEKEGFRFEAALRTIVSSEQFRMRRDEVREEVALND
ncbi:MAG: DUF1592 domain-containing protein [Opitutales bacterium]